MASNLNAGEEKQPPKLPPISEPPKTGIKGTGVEEATQTIARHGHQFSQRDFEEHFYSKSFELLVSDLELAIRQGIKPELIKQGSSGSYFCRSTSNAIVGVFKPKSEEPYGPNNPKMAKKVQRAVCPCMFGRGCLLSHQGYISEAGAYLVDQKLGLDIVPLTNVAWIASDSFNYSKSARNKSLMKSEINRRYPAIGAKFHRLGLKPKIGSLQQFVRDYKDANVFLNECNDLKHLEESDRRDFIEQFQRMVVLDYVIRNTDRGPANWLVKCEVEFPVKSRRKQNNANYSPPEGEDDAEEEEEGDEEEEERFYAAGNFKTTDENGRLLINKNKNNNNGNNNNNDDDGYRTSGEKGADPLNTLKLSKIRYGTNRQGSSDSLELIPMGGDDINQNAYTEPRIFIAAIDNGLAFPFKHPDEWRGYPFHWAGYSFAKIPFYDDVTSAVVGKLADMTFIEELVEDLHGLFSLDRDFTVTKFDRQMGVLRGQILNLTQAMKEGKSPAELVQMDCLMVEKRYPRKSFSPHGSISAHQRQSHPHLQQRPTASASIHPTTAEYSYINQNKKPKCGCCW